MFFKVLAIVVGMIFAVQGVAFGREKVALLFLTRGEPNHPNLWKELLAHNEDKYSVYIHSKEPMEDPYFQQYRTEKIVETSWSIHVKAWQVLIQEALKDSENQYFAFLSEACIPLYTLDYIHSIITSDPCSHMAFAGPWWPRDAPREVTVINIENRYGNVEWMVLNRKHAEYVAKDRAYMRIISRYPHDQESYFASFFSANGGLHEDMRCHSYTYVNRELSINNGANPYHFEEVSPLNDQLLEEAYATDALFARKFTKGYPELQLLQMINEKSKGRIVP